MVLWCHQLRRFRSTGLTAMSTLHCIQMRPVLQELRHSFYDPKEGAESPAVFQDLQEKCSVSGPARQSLYCRWSSEATEVKKEMSSVWTATGFLEPFRRAATQKSAAGELETRTTSSEKVHVSSDRDAHG